VVADVREGSLRSEAKGKFYLRFDNSYSFLKRKEVRYAAEVIDATDAADIGPLSPNIEK
jgi:hypothetical protein